MTSKIKSESVEKENLKSHWNPTLRSEPALDFVGIGFRPHWNQAQMKKGIRLL